MADLPPPPTLRALTAELREINVAYSHPDCGGEYVQLFCLEADFPYPRTWRVGCCPGDFQTVVVLPHREYVPGDSVERDVVRKHDGQEYVVRVQLSPWDAVGAARRLLAAANDCQCW